MLWIFSLAIIMPITLGSCEVSDLTAIKWAHAVNSWELLNKTLANEVEMIEADVVIGNHTKASSTEGGENIPIMAHPPSKQSDLSLAQFLDAVKQHNSKPDSKKKGIKLDFKTTDTFTKSVEVLKAMKNELNFTVWLNADILEGPVESQVPPVDASAFFNGAKELNLTEHGTLSIGWTTNWGSDKKNGNYTDEHVKAMIKAINDSNISEYKYPITFPVRAGIAAQSSANLHHLYNETVSQNNSKVSFTIWSSENDAVDVKALKELILSFGVDKVYVDVPEKLSKDLNLSNQPNSAATVQFAVLNVLVFAVATLFKSIMF